MTLYYVDPAATGIANGTSWGDAFLTLAAGVAAATTAGDILYARGTETLVGTVTITADGSAAGGFIKIIGCNAAGAVDGTRYKLDGNGGAFSSITINGANWLWLENLEITGAGGANDGIAFIVNYADYGVFANLYVHDNGGDGIDGGSCPRQWRVIQCLLSDNGGWGFRDQASNCLLAWCTISGNTAGGVNNVLVCYQCLAYENIGDNFYWCSFLLGCVSHGSSNDGIDNATLVTSNSLGCRITLATDKGFETTTGRHLLALCYFGGNGADIAGGLRRRSARRAVPANAPGRGRRPGVHELFCRPLLAHCGGDLSAHGRGDRLDKHHLRIGRLDSDRPDAASGRGCENRKSSVWL